MPRFLCRNDTHFNKKAVLKIHVDFEYLVGWSGRHEDSCGNSETDETPQARSVEEARRSP